MSLQDIAIAVVDAIMATIPRRIPDRSALQRCKIISHRGEHDNVRVMENTLQAFECARSVGVWGIEGDIRWTSDLVPVICHDPSPERVFGPSTPLRELSFSELRGTAPLIPSLEEVIQEFGGNTHLMLEIKEEDWPDPARQRAVIRELLSHLQPAVDYHFLALDPALFAILDFAPAHSFFPVAEINVSSLSRTALAGGYAGLAGHYLLLNNRLKKRHEAQGQRLGTGFPRSRNCLFRELNRGIEWVFTNDAVALQGIRDHYLGLR
jgi:glycerophosphoryl diester phosphodiesterase